MTALFMVIKRLQQRHLHARMNPDKPTPQHRSNPRRHNRNHDQQLIGGQNAGRQCLQQQKNHQQRQNRDDLSNDPSHPLCMAPSHFRFDPHLCQQHGKRLELAISRNQERQ